MIISLLSLTGRRIIEILKTADFKYVDTKHVLFSGQTKIRGEKNKRDKYIIPVLADAGEIVHALKYVRKNLDLQDVSNVKINATHERRILDYTKTFFKNINSNKHIKLNNKALRCMYARACYVLFDIEGKQTFAAYASSILGHQETDLNTVNSYSVFHIKKKVKECHEFSDLID